MPRLILLFIIFQITSGCFYDVTTYSKEYNTFNTEILSKLRSANQSDHCFDSVYMSTFNSIIFNQERKRVEKSMSEIFLQLFPLGTELPKIKESLQTEAGAICRPTTDIGINHINETTCTFSNKMVWGMKRLTWTGWRISSALWQVDNFEYRITARDNRLSAVKGSMLDGECDVIDKTVYEDSGQIVKLKKLKFGD